MKQIHIPFSVRKPEIDESQISTSNPMEKVKQLATLKGKNIPFLHSNEIILSADTIVSYDNHIFEKPIDKQDAFKMLSKLSGTTHEVFTGVMIRSKEEEVVFVEKAEVQFWSLSEAEMQSYIAMKEPYDKAGAYGIQGIGARFVQKISGDYFTIVGLPISRVYRELKDFCISPSV